MRKDPYLIELFTGVGLSLDEYKAYLDDVALQFNVDTATWGLDVFEKELGVIWRGKPIDDRRASIKAKWRSSGKSDIYLIQQVADAWKNGKVKVEFREDGKIHIIFVGEYGVPTNLEDLENAIDEVKPAHLPLFYHFAYLLIKDIHEVMTINQLQNTKINNFAFINRR